MMRVLLAVMLIVIACPATADESEWRLEKDAGGTQIYSRAVEGCDIREIRGVSEFGGSMASLLAVIDDVPVMPEFNTGPSWEVKGCARLAHGGRAAYR